jgi:ribosome-binding protein aMBF1 (putative translation factor)
MPKVEITVAFAAVLRKHRAAKGMSQDVLAEKAVIHPTHVGCVVEHGQALAPESRGDRVLHAGRFKYAQSEY